MYTFNIPELNPEKLFLEGVTAYKRGDSKHAVEMLNAAIFNELQKNSMEKSLLSDIYNTRGELYLSEGAFLMSYNDFTDAISCNPQNENAICNLGLWYMSEIRSKPDYKEALKYFDLALSMVPGRQDIVFKRAIARIESGNFMGFEDLKKLELEKYEAAAIALSQYGE